MEGERHSITLNAPQAAGENEDDTSNATSSSGFPQIVANTVVIISERFVKPPRLLNSAPIGILS